MTSENDADITKAFAEFRDVVDCLDVDVETRVNEYNKFAEYYDQVSGCNNCVNIFWLN